MEDNEVTRWMKDEREEDEKERQELPNWRRWRMTSEEPRKEVSRRCSISSVTSLLLHSLDMTKNVWVALHQTFINSSDDRDGNESSMTKPVSRGERRRKHERKRVMCSFTFEAWQSSRTLIFFVSLQEKGCNKLMFLSLDLSGKRYEEYESMILSFIQ